MRELDRGILATLRLKPAEAEAWQKQTAAEAEALELIKGMMDICAKAFAEAGEA